MRSLVCPFVSLMRGSPSSLTTPTLLAHSSSSIIARRAIHYSPARCGPTYNNPNDPTEFHIGSSASARHTTDGKPFMYIATCTNPTWSPMHEYEFDTMPRDEFGVPASIPPEVSTQIKHVYYVPPQFYPALKRWGDDTPELRPFTDALSKMEMTHDMFEEMFYTFAKPLKLDRSLIPMPFRTESEKEKEEEVKWESAWLSFRQEVAGDYSSQIGFREFFGGVLFGLYWAWVWNRGHRQYREDMKLFYVEAPEHKINWVTPRGDLV